MSKNIAVFGIYPNRESVQGGIEELRSAGFRNTDTSVLLSDNSGTKDFGHEKATKAPEGAALGAAAGAVIIGVLGWLVGKGILVLPEAGPMLVAGPIMSVLAGMGAGGTVGGILGALLGATMPEYEAKRYKGRRRNGGILLSVHCDDSQWAHKAVQVLTASGAEHIATTAEGKADYAAGDRPAPRRPSTMAPNGVPRPPANAADVLSSHPPEHALDGHPLSSLRRLAVRDVMTKDIDVVEEGTTLAEAAQKMRRLDLGLLPVRSGESIAGVLTDRDITVRASSLGLSPAEATAGSVMTTNYVCCFDHQDLLEAAKIMERRQVRRLPVLDKEMRLVGIVSLSDLAAKAGDERLAGEVLRLVATSKG